MPFERPSLAEIREQARRDFNARLPGADALLAQSNLSVIADVWGGIVMLHYGYQGWMALQLMPDTAETVYLERWASIWGLARRPAVAATGAVLVTGTAGAVVPAGAEFLRIDRVVFQTPDGATLDAAGTATVAVQAVTVGRLGNTAPGVQVQTVGALPGVVAAAFVDALGIGGGADIETDDALRARLLFRIQRPPMGGSASDYVAWALEVPGVTRAWVTPVEQGAGTVVVRFTMDDDQHPNGIPWLEDVVLVRDHLNGLRPVTARVIVLAPVPHAIDVAITRLTPDTPTVRRNVEIELHDTLFRHGAPGQTVFASWLWEAISMAAGEQHHTLVEPPGDVPLPAGDLPILGSVTYV
jgi:uncharacterized phage protein gp47/JayE